MRYHSPQRALEISSLAFAVILASSSPALAQNIYPATGNVGFGTTTPTAPLEILSSSPGVAARLLKLNAGATGDGTGEYITTGLGLDFGAQSSGPFSTRSFQVRSAAGTMFFVGAEGTQAGLIGLGTTNPLSRLDIVGGPTFSLVNLTPFKAYGNLVNSVSLANRGCIEFKASNTKYYIGATDDDGGGLLLGVLDTAMGTGAARILLHKSGNVGIGTYNPTSKLEVNGTIKAREVVVTATGWPDYVFDARYPLLPLPDLERTIQAEGKLPGIPSAKRAACEGVAVGDMQQAMLKKIEELTLYMIEADKQMQHVRASNTALQARIASLEKVVAHRDR
jgi:hypothetical protein